MRFTRPPSADAQDQGRRAKEALGREVEAAMRRLRTQPSDDDALTQARALVKKTRDQRDFISLNRLAEAVGRVAPKDATTRKFYAQGLIETGHASAAADVLRVLAQRLPVSDPEWAEVKGLLGRAHKQIFMDSGDKTGAAAREALRQAIEAYRQPFEADPAKYTWQGVNLVAVLTAARRIGLRVAPTLVPAQVARHIVEVLSRTPETDRDGWYHGTLAEAYLALGEWDAVESHLHAYVADRDVTAFHLASTLRQLTEVWGLDRQEQARGQGLLAVLQAQLVRMPGGDMDLSPAEVRRLGAARVPEAAQLEAVLGADGPKTYQWWQKGLECARSVAAIYVKLGNRHGTGFLVRARDLGLEPHDELLVLTNHHVVNDPGTGGAIPPTAAEVAFEAVDSTRYDVASVRSASPVDRYDAALLRLDRVPEGIRPLPISARLPVVDETDPARVYVIGYPGGRELAFSFQDNELLDHEGPPGGKPAIPGVVRVHYRAPTEGGSSGSPVFNADLWEVIALHHMGGKSGIARLNGKAGTYAANEGISVQSMTRHLE